MDSEIVLRIADKATGFDWKIWLPFGFSVAGFCFGIRQYIKAQTWKRVEFVASEMKDFFNDEAAKAAMTMLDWNRKQIMLYRFRNDSDTKPVWVDYDLVSSALGIDHKKHYNRKEAAVREIFDRFLGFLERFENFIDSHVVKEDDLKHYMSYWTRMLAGKEERSPQNKEKVLIPLWTFITFFRYEKAKAFVERFQEIDAGILAEAEKRSKQESEKIASENKMKATNRGLAHGIALNNGKEAGYATNINFR